MRRTLILAILSGALVVPSISFAQGSGADTPGTTTPVTSADRERVALLLGAYHELPDQAAFLAASPRAREVLTSMAGDARLFPPHRVRALDALARYWNAPEVFALTASWLADPATRDTTRHDLLTLAARRFGASSVPLVAPYLRHADLQLRLTAVHALDLVDTKDAMAQLEAALATETSQVVRKAIEEATLQVR
jgi:integrase